MVIVDLASMAANLFCNSASTLSLVVIVASRLLRYAYRAYSLVDSFANCWVCIVYCYANMSYRLSWCCCCICYSSETFLYASVMVLENSAMAEAFAVLSCSSTVKRSCIAVLFESM